MQGGAFTARRWIRRALCGAKTAHAHTCKLPLRVFETSTVGVRAKTVVVPSLWSCRREFHQTTQPWLDPWRGVAMALKERFTIECQPKQEQEQQQNKNKKDGGAEKPKVSETSLATTEAWSTIPVYRVVTHVIRHLWPRGEPKYRALVAISILCALAAKVLKVAVPFWFRMIVDTLTPVSVASSTVATIGPIQLGIFGLVTAYGITRLTNSLTEELKSALFAPVGGHASTTIAMELFSKLHSLDLRYHLGRETGVLSKDLDRGSRAFWSLSHALLFMILPTAFEIVLVCTALQTNAGPAFIITALLAVFSYIGWTYAISNVRALYRARFNKSDSRVGGLIVDSLLNYETVKYFARESHEEKRIYQEINKMNHELIKLEQSMSLLNFGQNAIFVIAALVSLYLSTAGVLAGTLTVGDMILIDALLMQLYTPLSFLGMLYREVQISTQNMQAMIALLDLENSVTEKPDAIPLKITSGTIEIQNVSFAFGDKGEQHILRNLSLTIPGGKMVAFVGHSGSGKSTIFRLLCRFYDPTSGEILIDGQPLPDLQLQSLRRAIGVVPQDTVLFNETVRYNIRYGRLEATDEEVEHAARLANIHDAIMKMSNQYETSVGERGLRLSGGERQRIAIARALLGNPHILLADEATSALDSVTEMRVMEQLREVNGAKRTIVLIAHRLSTVKNADIIFVLDGKGGLAEGGTHEKLLEKNGLYSKLWLQQLRSTNSEGEGEG